MKLTENLFLYPEREMPSCNTYVIKDDISVIIDTGLEMHLQGLIQDMAQDGIKPEDIDLITNTHLHLDHCWANQAFKDISGAEIAIHTSQKEHFKLNLEVVTKFFAPFLKLEPKTIEFKEDSLLDNKLNTGNMEFELLHTPGHSPDCICFFNKKEGILICGDVVFNQSTGRVDIPGGNAEEIKRSIEMLSQLEIEYLLPGHLNIVKGKEAIKKNFDFVREYVFPWLY
jgi:glyoxylase-like metal-dependent hydrolase (beta-lactamase superfamily II)